MKGTTEMPPSAPYKSKFTNHWILIITSVLLLLILKGVTPAFSSNALSDENLLITAKYTPTAATATSTPTLTKTMMATPAPEITINAVISSSDPDLRAGPGRHYASIRKLNNGEPLKLLGRYVYDTWLYVNTSDGLKGWVRINAVNLNGVRLNYQPVQTPGTYPEVTISVSYYSGNLYSGPATYYIKLGKLSPGDSLTLLGQVNDHSWLYVRTSDDQEGWIKTESADLDRANLLYDYYPIQTPPPTETSTPVVLPGIEGHWIDIDLSEQTLYAYDGSDRVASFLVSTGINRYPTETGQYHIYVKYVSSLMHGTDYYLPDVPFTMYYSGDFSIHGTYWHHNFGVPMSHGCVNMDTRDAEWLFNWASVGTLVNIHR